MRLLGPNCQGVVSVRNKLAGTFSNALWAKSFGDPMRVAYIGQSGAVGGALFDLGRERGCLPSVWISTGNQADVGVVEFADYLVDRPDIDTFMLYVEEVPDYQAWSRFCARARDLGKNVVVLNAGRSDAGRRAIASHTGAITSPNEAFDAVTSRYGVKLTRDVNDMIDIAMLWNAGTAQAGPRLGVVTTSGGMGCVAADLAAHTKLDVTPLQPTTVERLSQRLPAFATAQNPVDVTADLVTSRPRDFGEVCQAVAEDRNVDLVVVLLSAVIGEIAKRLAAALVAARAAVTKPFAVVYLSSHDRTGDVRAVLAAAHMPVFDSVSQALSAISAASPDRRGWQAAEPRPEARVDAPMSTSVVTEAQATELLQRAGVSTPQGRLAATRSEAVEAAQALGGRLVLKVQSPDILHKSDLGLVKVGVESSAVGGLFDLLVARVHDQAPDAHLQGVLVQRQVEPGTELLVGVQAQKQGFPPVVTVGIGGVGVEIYADAASDVLPINRDQALALLHRLRGWPLLNGFRGGTRRDIDAAIDAIVAMSKVADDLGPQFLEFEVNPLIVHEEGHGATAADFVAHLSGSELRGREHGQESS
jgi:acyl-CoA synthetase (NDP forming)